MASDKTQDFSAEITQAYTFQTPSIDLGVLAVDDEPVTSARIRIPLSMFNRHGLISGATGTGKTVTLQLLAESLSSAGVPVFAADLKGDLSGLATAGTPSEKLLARTSKNGQEWAPIANPVEFYSLGGQGLGIPLRATVSSFGPILLAKVLGLNTTQESSLGLVFHYADQNGLALVDLSDLVAVLTWLTSPEGKESLAGIGGLASQTAGVILRSIINLQAQGADVFFGEPEFDTTELFRLSADGRGIISMLELPNLQDRPALFSTFLMWLLADIYQDLPEVGDLEKPKLVFFFDEAHLLFKDASKAFLDQITQTVRLIRSKGVGVFFITQTAKDVPADVAAQLGSRIQHQLRAFTPADDKAIKATVNTFPHTDYDLEELLTTLGTGQAVVSVLNPDGAPTPVAWTRIFSPGSVMGPSSAELINRTINASQLLTKYLNPVDPESAREILAARLAAGAEQEAGAQGGGVPLVQRNENGRPPARGGAKAGPSVISQVANSSVFKQFARSAGREFVRALFGTGRRRRR